METRIHLVGRGNLVLILTNEEGRGVTFVTDTGTEVQFPVEKFEM